MLFALASPGQALAAVYSYVDWTEADVAAGTASGTITLPDESTVDVTFEAINDDGSPGTLYGAQVDGGTNYWAPSEPFISEEVENAPPSPDILQLSGGLDQIYRVTLSEPIKDPVMAIVSLGQPGVRTTYDFDAPFTIVSQGKGYWGGTDTSLAAVEGDVLEGYEGHGTIRFLGTFDTFSWTVPTPETWHGFTFAIRTTERIEPTPSEGGAGGMGGAGSEGESPVEAGAGGTAGEGAIGGAGGAGEPVLAGGGGLAGEAGGGGSEAGGKPGSGGAATQGGATSSRGGLGGTGREDTEPDVEARCHCSVPGVGLTSNAPAFAFAVALAAALRRKRRRL